MHDDVLLAVDYSRYSQDTQDSVEDQQDMNDETALEIGARIVQQFSDEAVSRSISDREDLVKMLAYLQDHREVRCLIIPQWDRLVGGLTQHTDVITKLRRLKVKLATYDGWLDYTDDDVLTELERKSLSSAEEVRRARKRVRKALRTKNRKGRYTSRPPFGLRMKPVLRPDGTEVGPGEQLLDDKGRVIRSAALDLDPATFTDPDTGNVLAAHEWLVRIFEWTASDVPALEVCRRLHVAGVQTKQGSTTWTTQALARIISNRTYLGERVWGATRIVHDDYGNRKYHEAREADDREIVSVATNLGSVIDRDLWQHANDVAAERRRLRQRSPRRTEGRTYAPRVLSDLVFCGRCGLKMYARRDSKILASGEQAQTWRYGCEGRVWTKSGRRRFDADERQICTTAHSFAEKSILHALEGAAARNGTVEFVEARLPAQDTRAAREAAQHSIKLAQAAIARIKDAYDDGQYSKDELRERTARHQAAIESAEAQIDTLDDEQDGPGSSVPDELRLAVEAAMRELLTEATAEFGTVERTTRVRAELRSAVCELITRIEVDAPSVRVHLRRPTGA